MPNIITHTLFADEMMDLLDLEELNSHKRLVRIGSSGPDICFFHNMPFKAYEKTPLHRMGNDLHKQGMYAFYESALASIRAQKNPEIREQMIAYTAGFLFHWALDSTVQPYIFYRTGIKGTGSASSHHRMESLIDAIFLKVLKNTSIKDYDVTELVCATFPEHQRAIARVLVPALKAVFDEEVRPYMITETLKDWQSMQKIFRDPEGTKSSAFRVIEKPLHLDNLFSGYAVPAVIEDNWDIMNLLHSTWKNPVSGEKYTDSVFELFEKAKHRAAKAVQLFLEAVADPSREEVFLDEVKDINYLTDREDAGQMAFFDVADLSI